MENDKREYKDKGLFANKQRFYFNENGQLVVESNKGVWVDGEKYVKMYGDFVCNAKTMGEIIHQLKGIAVEVGQYEKAIYSAEQCNLTAYCVLGASKERIEEYEKELAKQEFVHERIEELQKQCEEYEAKIYGLNKSIYDYNRLPWWKRIFKKIEVK